jgi:hypothetical protein
MIPTLFRLREAHEIATRVVSSVVMQGGGGQLGTSRAANTHSRECPLVGGASAAAIELQPMLGCVTGYL